jgi:hypothetical protein
MDLAQLRALAASVGFVDPSLAAAVAMAESGGNSQAIGDNGNSFGLWQINIPSHPQYDGQSLLDPNANADAAFAISRGGQNWQPWTTYRTGAYKQFYTPSTTPAPWLTTSRAMWISLGILTAGGATAWWLTRSPREKRRIRRMLPA